MARNRAGSQTGNDSESESEFYHKFYHKRTPHPSTKRTGIAWLSETAHQSFPDPGTNGGMKPTWIRGYVPLVLCAPPISLICASVGVVPLLAHGLLVSAFCWHICVGFCFLLVYLCWLAVAGRFFLLVLVVGLACCLNLHCSCWLISIVAKFVLAMAAIFDFGILKLWHFEFLNFRECATCGPTPLLADFSQVLCTRPRSQ